MSYCQILESVQEQTEPNVRHLREKSNVALKKVASSGPLPRTF